jgi:predicted transcriptional regulator
VISRYYYGVTMAESTTLKLPEKLKARIARLAKQTSQSSHSFMLRALEREVSREEKMRDFVRAALASKAEIDAGGSVYRAEDVHAWMERLAKGENPPRPTPWRR